MSLERVDAPARAEGEGVAAPALAGAPADAQLHTVSSGGVVRLEHGGIDPLAELSPTAEARRKRQGMGVRERTKSRRASLLCGDSCDDLTGGKEGPPRRVLGGGRRRPCGGGALATVDASLTEATHTPAVCDAHGHGSTR